MCATRLKIYTEKSLPPFARLLPPPQKKEKIFAQPFFFVVFFHVTPNGLSERGNIRSLDASKDELFHLVRAWKLTLKKEHPFIRIERSIRLKVLRVHPR